MPENIEVALRQYARRHPEDAHGIERVLTFRRQVSEQFEGLLRDRDTWLAVERARHLLAPAAKTNN